MDVRLAGFVFAALLAYSSANNTTGGIPECMSNDDCATDRVCAKQECMNPCAGVCGPHTVCHVTNHVAMCACSPGHSGHPILGCSASKPECMSNEDCTTNKVCAKQRCEDPCSVVCGPHTVCRVINHVAMCSCRPHHTGNPITGCSAYSSGTWPPDPQGKKQYYVKNSKKHYVSWLNATMACLRNNSRLVSMESMDELWDVRREINNTRNGWCIHFWTSGTDAGRDGDFIWASTGTRVPTDMWVPGHLWSRTKHFLKLGNTFTNRPNRIEYELYIGEKDKACYICEYYS